jgi:CPA2 family monovalent cation:H+ antiporter-2
MHELLIAADSIEISWQLLEENSPLIDQALSESNIRSRSGASVVALIRQGHLIANPKSNTVFEIEDRIGLIGEPEHIETARSLIQGSGEI